MGIISKIKVMRNLEPLCDTLAIFFSPLRNRIQFSSYLRKKKERKVTTCSTEIARRSRNVSVIAITAERVRATLQRNVDDSLTRGSISSDENARATERTNDDHHRDPRDTRENVRPINTAR